MENLTQVQFYLTKFSINNLLSEVKYMARCFNFLQIKMERLKKRESWLHFSMCNICLFLKWFNSLLKQLEVHSRILQEAPHSHVPASPTRSTAWYSGFNWRAAWRQPLHQSPEFMLDFILGVIYLRVWQMCPSPPYQHGAVSLPHKSSATVSSSPLPPPTFGDHWSFHCLHSFAFSRMSYSWNDTGSLSKLAPFT